MMAPLRVVFISGYNHPSQHRKIELLADTPNVEILHIVPPHSGRTTGQYASADGQRAFHVRVQPLHSLGQPGDPHRVFHYPPSFGLRRLRPHIIQCEYEQESVLAAQVALARWVLAPHSFLILNSAQNILRQRGPEVRAIDALTLRAADHVMCWSQEAATVLRQQGYHRSTSIMPTIGLDSRYFYPKPVNELRRQLGLSGSVVVGYIGRLVPEKGVDTLLHAVPRARSAISLAIVGDGPERSGLETLAQHLGITDRCIFTGSVPYDLVPNYLNLLDMLVLPSRTTRNWKEQFGRVLVEAMGCRVVVVGSDSGAIPEVIGEAGRLFPEGDALALATVIDDLAQDPELRRTLGECGYQRALERYSVERIAARTLAVWRELIASRCRP
jgi:glycosyltransferase involved in cell wall biosynthesis